MHNAISKKIYDERNNLFDSFLVSLSLHVGILLAVVYLNISKPIPLKAQEKMIVLSLQSFTNTQVAKEISTSVAVEKPKHTEQSHPKKVLHKEIKKVEKVVETKTLQKSSQEVKKVVKPSEAFTPQQDSTEQVAKETSLKADSSNIHSPKMTKNSPVQKAQMQNIGPEELAHIRLMIENALSYPIIAKKLRLEGVVVVSFSLHTDGFLQNLQIVSSSGSSVLDNKALQTVASLDGEYPHLEKNVDLKLPIAFSLHKS